MKRALIVVLAFGLVSVALTFLWNEWGRDAYATLFKFVARPVYDAIGFSAARVGAYRDRYINFVPFVSLVLVTPGIGFRRRSIGLGLGLVTIFVSHLALNLTEGLHPGPSLPVVPAIFSDAFPFLLWVAVAYPVVVRFFPSTPEGPVGVGDDSNSGAEQEPD